MQKGAAQSICTFFHAYRPLRKAQILNDGFQRFAAFCRSIRVRRGNDRDGGDRGDIHEIYTRLKALALSYKGKEGSITTIGTKTRDAAGTLQAAKTIPDVLCAVKALEHTTQTSSECCEIFASTHSPTTLFSLIRACNRSAPHQELLKGALVVLLNVSRHGGLARRVAAVPDSSCVLVDLMQVCESTISILKRLFF